jgi:16S rRNA (cytosine1402-N4)-methyltransferase
MSVTMSAAATHIPVLLEETVEALAVRLGGRYIDCTLGTGGHAAAILERSAPGGQLLGIDADPEAIRIARERLSGYGGSVLLVNDNFVNLKSICDRYGFMPVNGVLFDLGLSTLQLDGSGRGFSFRYDEPLDMRFSPSQEITAADIVNNFPEEEVAEIIRDFGEDRFSYRIARRIVKARPLETTFQLAEVVERAVGGRRGRIHPATRTFQALRIAVNEELSNLASTLEQAVSLLGFGGRIAVISYHSLEDRIVKYFMRQEGSREAPTLRVLTKKVIKPSPAEIQLNPRSRSAKLRVAEKVV